MALRSVVVYSNELMHYGVLGQKWGTRNYQNEDGSYKPGAEGRYYTPVGGTNARPISNRERNKRSIHREREIGRNQEKLATIKPYLTLDRKSLSDVKKNGLKSESFKDTLGTFNVKKSETKRDSDGVYRTREIIKTKYYLKDNFSEDDGGTSTEVYDSKKEALAAYTKQLESEIKRYNEAKNEAEKSISILEKASLDEPTFLEAREAGQKAFNTVMTAGVAATTVASVALMIPTAGLSLYMIYPGLVASVVASTVASEKAHDKVNETVKKEYRIEPEEHEEDK